MSSRVDQYWTTFSRTNSVKVSRNLHPKPQEEDFYDVLTKQQQQPFLNCDLVAINRDPPQQIFQIRFQFSYYV